MAFPLTEEQKNIVDDKGGELLVSAAAGSGKTRAADGPGGGRRGY